MSQEKTPQVNPPSPKHGKTTMLIVQNNIHVKCESLFLYLDAMTGIELILVPICVLVTEIPNHEIHGENNRGQEGTKTWAKLCNKLNSNNNCCLLNFCFMNQIIHTATHRYITVVLNCSLFLYLDAMTVVLN